MRICQRQHEGLDWRSWDADRAVEEAGNRGWITREGLCMRLTIAVKEALLTEFVRLGAPEDIDHCEFAQEWLDTVRPVLDTQSEEHARLVVGMTFLATGENHL